MTTGYSQRRSLVRGGHVGNYDDMNALPLGCSAEVSGLFGTIICRVGARAALSMGESISFSAAAEKLNGEQVGE